MAQRDLSFLYRILLIISVIHIATYNSVCNVGSLPPRANPLINGYVRLVYHSGLLSAPWSASLSVVVWSQ